MVGKLFKVVISRNAHKSLTKINNYYKKDVSPAVAKKVREGLVAEAKTLDKLPASKPLLKSKSKITPAYRYTKKWSFKIIFQIFKKKDKVNIVDFVHDKENPEKWENL